MFNEAYNYDLDSDTNTSLRMFLFKNVQNVDFIRNNIIKGTWKCTVVKASLIVNPLQVAVAANRAVVSQQQKSMVTRTVFAEILYNLSLTKNISQSLSKFGVEKDSNLLICFLVSDDNDESEKDIIPQIEGELCPMSELSSFSSLKDIKSVYKLNNLKYDVDLLDVIVSRMVTKNFVSY